MIRSRGYGKPSSLAKVHFGEVIIPPNSIQAFYISLSSSHLVLSSGSTSGSIHEKNSDLAIYTGVAVSNSPFIGNNAGYASLVWNQIFNGIVHYEVEHGAHKNPGVHSAQLQTSIPAQQKIMHLTFEGGNGGSGVMFDIFAKKDITIQTFDIHVAVKSEISVEVYTKKGTFVGHEYNPASWISQLLFSADVVGNGPKQATSLPEIYFTTVQIKAGDVQAFYVTLKTGAIVYSNGNGSGKNDEFRSNDDLRITEGAGLAQYKFAKIFSPRVFNGNVYYAVDNPNITRIPGEEQHLDVSNSFNKPLFQLQTTMKGENGSYGAMFDIVPNRDVTVRGFKIHTRSTELLNMEVWTRKGSHQGHENNAIAWENILPRGSKVKGLGLNHLTELPSQQFTPIKIYANTSQALYITLTTPELRYSNGNLGVGKVYRNDDVIEVKEGVGIGAFPFGKYFYPRNWNGVILYEIGTSSDAVTTQEIVTARPSNFPSKLPSKPPNHATTACAPVSSKTSFRPATGTVSAVVPNSAAIIGTSYTGNNGSYGTCFDIATKKNPIVVQGINIHVQTNNLVLVEVYTRVDTHVGFENMKAAWTRIVHSNVRGRGRFRPTKIPPSHMVAVYIPANSTQGFYITITTPDLRYTNINSKIGTGCVGESTNEVDLLVGVGIGGYPFGQTYQNRLFNGELVYALVE
eukprot:CAMPEP_0194447672 /NCGR_PEP_ID=MMETSP0176-20130528/129142_1 /TAXON_ID=216777 /ORGANISM="Proboscia alata, Strain PI-D3" /LENGTH=684 /DNA_ID=CAMNT_0039274555 /DNA_START=965 /DNA_END=3019 /DNA_ORIENTATION=-